MPNLIIIVILTLSLIIWMKEFAALSEAAAPL